jgi:16S rRNA processing protein RimM
MDKDNFFCLGKISKTFGYRGQVIVICNTAAPEKYEKLEFVFVQIQHERVPFFITEFNLQFRNSIALKFEDIDSSEDAQKLLGCLVYILESEQINDDNQELNIAELQEFKVTDTNKGYLGVISRILELPQQHIMQIFQGEKELLIPLSPDFIIKIDHKKKTMLIDTPEGLIEFYQQ